MNQSGSSLSCYYSSLYQHHGLVNWDPQSVMTWGEKVIRQIKEQYPTGLITYFTSESAANNIQSLSGVDQVVVLSDNQVEAEFQLAELRAEHHWEGWFYKNSNEGPSSGKRILLGQLGSYGDCLYASSLAAQIKDDYPGCHLTWAIGSLYKDAIALNPFVDAVWEIPLDHPQNMAVAWMAFMEEAQRMYRQGEFDEMIFSQINPGNFKNYDGTIRSSIFRGYSNGIRVPVNPIVRLSTQEVSRAKTFVKHHRLHDQDLVIIFEWEGRSHQTFVGQPFALAVAQQIAERIPQAVVILSGKTSIPAATDRVIDGSQLTIREMAELTHWSHLFLGVSSGISWMATSTWAKPLPMIQLLRSSTGVYASMVHDAKYLDLPTEGILELQECSPSDVCEVVKAVYDHGFSKARAQYHDEMPLDFTWYCEMLKAGLMAQGRWPEVLQSVFYTWERFGSHLQLTQFLDGPVRLGIQQEWHSLGRDNQDAILRYLKALQVRWSPRKNGEAMIAHTTHHAERLSSVSRPQVELADVCKVTAIVSTYASEGFITECLDDLVGQTIFDQMEIVIVDSGSPEAEKDIILEYQQRFPNITYLRTQRETVYAAWNRGIRLARGTYITPFSTNDRLKKDAYEILANTLDSQQDVVLVYGDTYLTRLPHETFEFHTRCGQWRWPEYSFEDLLHNCRVGPHPMWRRNVHETIGYFDEQYKAIGDQEFWLRMGEQFNLMHIPEVTGLYWVSPEGLSNQLDVAQPEQTLIRNIYLERHQVQVPKTQRVDFDCSIIIPVFNKVELTQQCVTNLADVTNGCSYEVIVVDNASTDDTKAFLSKLGGDIQIISNPENYGFAKACNQGAAAANGRYLVFLNNDTIPKPGWLRALLNEVEGHQDVAIVGSKLLYPDNTIQHAGVVISRLFRTPYHLFVGVPENFPAVNIRKEFQAVTAACMLVRKETFEEVLGFDEGFVNGYEDIDLCLRVRQLEKKIVYQPKSCLYHLESQTSGRNTHDSANALRFIARWEHLWLEDEDLVAAQNGYVIQQEVDEGRLRSSMVPKQKLAHSAAWQRVVELQKLLLGRSCQPLTEMTDRQNILNVLIPVDAWPNDIGILEWAGRVCGILQCEQEAIKFWEKLLEMGDHPNARLGLARVMLKHGNLDDSQKHLDEWKRVFPPREDGCTLQGILSMQKQEFSDAKDAFEKALTFDGESNKARIGLGMAWLGLDNPSKAWEVFEQVLAGDPDNSKAIGCLIQAGTALQQWEGLSGHLAKYIERNPADCDTRFAFAGVAFRAGHPDQAKEQLTWLRLVQPDFEGLEDLDRVLANPQDQGRLVSVR